MNLWLFTKDGSLFVVWKALLCRLKTAYFKVQIHIGVSHKMN